MRKINNLINTFNKEDKPSLDKRIHPFETCSTAIIKTNPLLNRDLCKKLDPLHEKMYSHMLNNNEPGVEELHQILDVLNEIYILLQRSFHEGASNGLLYAADLFSATPLSSRQGSRAMAVIDLLYEQKWAHAYHEMYDMIDDFGFGQKEYLNRYKEVSVNEFILYSIIVGIFIKEISNSFNFEIS